MPELENLGAPGAHADWSDVLIPLFDSSERLELAAGQTLFERGESSTEVYFVERGAVDVVLETRDGLRQSVARFRAGAVFGEMAGLLQESRTAAVVARERTIVRRVDPTAWLAKVSGSCDPADRFVYAMLRMLADRVQSMNRLLLDLLDDDGASELGVPPAAGVMDGPVKTAPTLTLADLRALVSGELLALRIPRYYSRSACRAIYRRLLRHPAFARYSIAPDVGVQRVGYSLFETERDPQRLRDYLEQAVPTIDEVRTVCMPYLTPIDRLRVELDERWPGGAALGRLEGHAMFVGIARMFEDGHALPPHQDVAHRDTTDPMARQFSAQLTANLYLRPPTSGGELEVWHALLTDEEAAAYYTGVHDFFDRTKLGDPAASVRPEIGDLVLFLASRVHAVRPGYGGPRVSMSCFIGATTESEPMRLWS